MARRQGGKIQLLTKPSKYNFFHSMEVLANLSNFVTPAEAGRSCQAKTKVPAHKEAATAK